MSKLILNQEIKSFRNKYIKLESRFYQEAFFIVLFYRNSVSALHRVEAA